MFSKGYSTTAFVGATFGFIQFFASVFVARRSRLVTWFVSKDGMKAWGVVHMYLALQICLLIVMIWTGKVLMQMEGELVGKKSKRGKKHRKGKKKSQAWIVYSTNKR